MHVCITVSQLATSSVEVLEALNIWQQTIVKNTATT